MFMILFSLVGWAQELSWEGMIQSYSNAIVSIKIASNRNFDTEKAGTGVATGFVVDAKSGLILTNRHVVEPGPVSSYAVLMNNEEIPLVPVYRDPVHDFGFYRYNPKDVQYMELPEIQLCSKCAQMGLEVRLIGNNAGEKISILPGTLARLDRNAPNYGTGKYNDFNTFYIQAAAGSSGGSSGSPVLSKEGMAVALNAGGSSRSASSFFLPLDRVERALALIQKNQPVKRGTLEATFKQIPYDYASRLGVSKENTDAFRKAFPSANGLLVIQSVLSKGVSDQKLMTGDVLISLNEKLIKDFVSMETILDSAVGQTVDIVVERGGEVKRFVIPVQDLHSITPDKFVEACGGIFHELSYQMARHYNVPIQGIFIANDGYCFDVGGVKRKAVLTAVNGVRLESIEQFWSIIKAQDDGVDLDVEFYYLSDRLRVLHTAVPWALKWFPTIRWTRNDATGIWDKEEVPRTIQKPTVSSESPSYSKWDKRLERTLAPSLVTVDFKIPYLVEGVYGDEFRGTGLILEEGLVAVDKDTVPIALGDAHITFAGQVRVPARVEWLHPEHNIALISYDKDRIEGEKPVRLMDRDPKVGKSMYIVGRNYQHEVVSRKTKILEARDYYSGRPRVPLFQQKNVTLYDVATAPETVGGVISDKRGSVYAMWASFATLRGRSPDAEQLGLSASVLQEALDTYKKDTLNGLGVFWRSIPIADAAKLGLTPDLVAPLEKKDPRRRIFIIERISSRAPAGLKVGDLILSVNGEAVVHFAALEDMVRAGELTFRVLRNRKVVTVKMSPFSQSGKGERRFLLYSGAVFQSIPAALQDYWGAPNEGAYVSLCFAGSPCRRDRLSPTRRVIAVNDKPVSSLDGLANLLKEEKGTLRFRLVDLKGQTSIVPIRPDLHYWPTAWLHYKEAGWRYETWK